VLPGLVALALAPIACGPGIATGTLDAGTRDGAPANDSAVPPPDGSALDATVPDATMSPPRRTGPVTLDDHSLSDDGGRFEALGATFFWAAWGYKNDRALLERNLAFLAENGFHFIRALGVVGDYTAPDSWDGREIDWHWPDYDDVIAGVTDLAYDVYGLRVEWTLIGDGQINIPNETDRYALADRFLAMAATRREKILFFEIANESWHNGFGGDEGVAQLRALTQYMRDRTDILVAASAPAGHECADTDRLYNGGIADLATLHFERRTDLEDGAWRPVRQPWGHEDCAEDLPVGVNNEPIGPGASVTTEEDPSRLVAAPLVTWVSNLPIHVFHSSAGVRGFRDISEMAGASSFAHLANIVPPGLSSFSRSNFYWADSPFIVHVEDPDGTIRPDAVWPDTPDVTSGVVRAYSGVDGNDFFTVAFGIRGDTLFAARRAMDVEVIDPLTGETLDTRTLAEAETFRAGGGRTVLVLRGAFR
jgi:hypothetical protein